MAVNIEKLQLDMGSEATGGTFGNIDGPNYTGRDAGWLGGAAGDLSPTVATWLAPMVAVAVVAGIVYWARGK